MSKIYQKNTKCISKIYPALSQFISQEKDVDWVDRMKSKNGLANCIVSNGAKKTTMHNFDDPKLTYKDFVEKTDFFKEDVTVLIGMGLGYQTRAILKKMEEGHRIVVIEPIVTILKEALKLYDYSKYIDNRSLLISFDDAVTGFFLTNLENQHAIRNWYMAMESYITTNNYNYNERVKYTSELINQLKCNTGTIISAGKQIAHNDIKNLPYVIQRRGIFELKDIYKDKPAILISTGPSLAKNIHLLKNIQDNVIIVAVGQALRILLAYDITPDFVCTVDFGDVNKTHFEGLMDCGVPLITINRAHAELLQSYKGPMFITAPINPGQENTAAGLLNEKGQVEQGGSVAHLCFSSAQLMGCNPITFIGQDLAYEGDLSHNPNHDVSGKVVKRGNDELMWEVTDPRSKLNGGSYSMGVELKIPGFYGENVTTNIGLMSFITVFEAMIKGYIGVN